MHSMSYQGHAKCLTWILYSLGILLVMAAPQVSYANHPNRVCYDGCHEDKAATGEKKGREISVYVEAKRFDASAHAGIGCVKCHADLAQVDEEELHEDELKPVNCAASGCHGKVVEQHTKSLHGKAIAKGDPLAPTCQDCHGAPHFIVPKKSPLSPTAALNVPYMCGKCHQEGTKVMKRRVIHQDHIIENFSESIHGEGLLRKGLVVAPNCASCHSPHNILPHTDPGSSISRKNIAQTCTQCHAMIETVHRKVIKGELWEKEAHVLPACVDCHQPHKVRKVFYTQGMADKDCMRCHDDPNIKSSKDGRTLFVNTEDQQHSKHSKTACSQCHSEVNVSKHRPCETIQSKVDCSSCHSEVGKQYQTSMHGELIAKNDPNGPTCKECHGTHSVKGKTDPASPIFPTNVPTLCASCHREGEKAAKRYTGTQHEIIEHYQESIHGKGLMESGLTVTAMCTSCHTAHGVLPKSNVMSSVNPQNLPNTCGNCHYGIEQQYEHSVHSASVTATDKELPVCSDCHTAHTIQRADEEGFKLTIMQQCGNCHKQIAETYFETYHGKVSQLGYTKTAKCYDCHGSHNIHKVADKDSLLSPDNIVQTCQKCHPDANRNFTGYLAHATHHEPDKYPWLFWTFWGMTGLLVGTFSFFGLHTILWFPRALEMRRERKKKHQNKHGSSQSASTEEKK